MCLFGEVFGGCKGVVWLLEVLVREYMMFKGVMCFKGRLEVGVSKGVGRLVWVVCDKTLMKVLSRG